MKHSRLLNDRVEVVTDLISDAVPEIAGVERKKRQVQENQNEKLENKKQNETAPQAGRIIDPSCKVKPKDQLLDTVFQYDVNCVMKPKEQLRNTVTQSNLSRNKITSAEKHDDCT